MTEELNKPNKFIKSDYFLLLFLVVVSCLMLFINLDREDIKLYDEAVYTKHDIDLNAKKDNAFFPNHHQLWKRYFQKFPLKTWIKAKVFDAMGFSIFSIRFLDALMGVLTVIFLFLLGRYFFDRWIGAIASFILLTTKAFYINWTQTNQYDSGFILGSIAFIYFFIAHFNKKWGWLACGLSLAFAMYFKHVQSLIPLSIVILYLIIMKRWKDIFSFRFIGACLAAGVLLLAWLVPFYLQHNDFFKTFVSDEWDKRVFQGYFSSAGDPLFYFKSLSLLGNWIYLLPLSLIYFVYMIIKTKDKRMVFIMLWILFPFILMTIARSKLERYAYLFYPAIGLMIAAFLLKFYQLITESEKTKLFGKTILKIIFIIFLIFQFASSFRVNSTIKAGTFHSVSDYYNGDGKGTLIILNMKEKDLHLPEWIHVYCSERKSFQSVSLDKAISRMGPDDTLILSRSRFFNALNQGFGKKHDLSGIRFFAYSPAYTFVVTRPKVKIGIVNNGSRIAQFLESKGVKLYQPALPSSIVDYNKKNSGDFVRSASELILGYPFRKIIVTYYSELIDKRHLSKQKFVDILMSHAISGDYHYLSFSRQEKLPLE